MVKMRCENERRESERRESERRESEVLAEVTKKYKKRHGVRGEVNIVTLSGWLWRSVMIAFCAAQRATPKLKWPGEMAWGSTRLNRKLFSQSRSGTQRSWKHRLFTP